MPGPYTRLQLENLVAAEVQDTGKVYFTAATIQGFLNEGAALFCERTRHRRASTTIDVTAGSAVVDLSTLSPIVLDVLRVAMPSSASGTDEVELVHYAQEVLEARDPSWRTTRGTVEGYTRWNEGFEKILLYPIPDTGYTSYARSGAAWIFDSGYGGVQVFTGLDDTQFDSAYGGLVSASDKYGACRVDYVAGATSMTADTDTPYSTSEIPTQYHACLVDYAAHRCLRMYTPLQNVEKSRIYLDTFDAKVAEAATLVRSGFQKKPLKRVSRESF